MPAAPGLLQIWGDRLTSKGRKRFFSSPEEMQELIDRYFQKCEGELARDQNGMPVIDRKTQKPVIVGKVVPSKTGLAYALGFKDRRCLTKYLKYSEYEYTVARAFLRCEVALAEQTFSRNGYKPAKWMLVTNYGWSNEKGSTSADNGSADNQPAVVIVNPDGTADPANKRDITELQKILSSPMSRISLK